MSALLLAGVLAGVLAGTGSAPTRQARARGAAASAEVPGAPAGGVPSRYGPSGAVALGGRWLFRFDPGPGARSALERGGSTGGWAPVSVPHAWNANDPGDTSMEGTIGWYRKDFALPAQAAQQTWLVRFGSVNKRMRAWLNGVPIGAHAGPDLPFGFVLPAGALRAGAVNHLVVEVDNRRFGRERAPKAALYWNYGGILRRVYLERVDRVGFGAVQVLPRLACRTCDATLQYWVELHNYSAQTQVVQLRSTYGPLSVDLGTASVAPGESHIFAATTTLHSPHTWSPASPSLYDVWLRASLLAPGGAFEQATPVANYFLRSGVRSIGVSRSGSLLLNGQQLNFRGVGLMEDVRGSGAALSEASEARLIGEAQELGATVIRSQYPLDEYLEQLADERGIMLWSEIPFAKVPPRELARAGVRARALDEVRQNILANSSHPSIIVWSIANELSPTPDASQDQYIAAAAALSHRLDPTRPVGLAVAAYPSVGCQAPSYAPLDVIGLNDYFGWYPGPVGDLKDRNALPGYLDAMRGCYRGKALVISEFGVEANRPGPVSERGSYAFQQDFVQFHLKAFASKPWLAGAVYWALQEFRVRPGWNGGNPRPSPPMHTKGLISYLGQRKPAFYDVRKLYRAISQLTPP